MITLKLFEDPIFLQELKEAIEQGKQTDFGYNEETNDEFEYDVFNSDSAIFSVLELLKTHL